MGNTYWVIWVALLKYRQHRDRSFVVCWPPTPQSPVHVVLDLAQLVLEIRALKKVLHQLEDVTCDLRPSCFHPGIGLSRNISSDNSSRVGRTILTMSSSGPSEPEMFMNVRSKTI